MADPVTTQVYLPARAALRRLVEAGVVRGLDDAALDRLRAECWDSDEEQMEDAGLLGILTSFYESFERGRTDGFYWRDDQYWNQTEDVVAELAALLEPLAGSPQPLFRQLSVSVKLATLGGVKEEVHVLELQRDDGHTEELATRSLDDVVAHFNAALQARGAGHRIVPLDTSGEWRMYVAMDLAKARTLAAEGALPIDDMEPLLG
jgi:hypothetical protein